MQAHLRLLAVKKVVKDLPIHSFLSCISPIMVGIVHSNQVGRRIQGPVVVFAYSVASNRIPSPYVAVMENDSALFTSYWEYRPAESTEYLFGCTARSSQKVTA